MITKVEGIIISTVNYGETSLVINLLTKEYGIIGLIAKGAKSIKNRLHALTSNYTHGNFYIYYKENKLSTLKEVDIINYYNNIHNDIYLISYMAYLVDLASQVYKENNNKEIYDLLILALEKINASFDPLVITNIIEVKYLTYLGVSLSLDSCAICGNTKDIVTISDGSLICKNCYTNERLVNLNTIKLLRIYKYLDLKSISKLAIKEPSKSEINQILSEYYTKYTGLYLKSKNFLTKLKEL